MFHAIGLQNLEGTKQLEHDEADVVLISLDIHGLVHVVGGQTVEGAKTQGRHDDQPINGRSLGGLDAGLIEQMPKGQLSFFNFGQNHRAETRTFTMSTHQRGILTSRSQLKDKSTLIKLQMTGRKLTITVTLCSV